MLSAPCCRGDRVIVLLFAVSATLLFSLFMFSESFSRTSLDYAQQVHDKWNSVLKHGSTTQAYNCADPYRRPGYLYLDKDDYKQTRWIPYTDEFFDADDPPIAEYPKPEGMDVFFNVTEVEPDFAKSVSTPQSYTHTIVEEDHRRRHAVDVLDKNQKPEDFESMKEEGDLGWLWGRRVVLLGDSVDRFMMQFFCEEFGRKMTQPAPHTTATCIIPTFNLTITHWHFAGSWNYRPDWWWMKDMKAIAFEDRWEKYWKPMVNNTIRGPNGRPDLFMWQNGLWDQRALWECGEAHYSPEEPLGIRERHLSWEEVRFIAARIKKLVNFLSDEFPSTPTMFRAITVHNESSTRDTNIYELDRISRAVAERAGHEIFEWGRLITAFSDFYRDQTHPGKGPASWLWGNMMLEYLKRSAGAGDEERKPYFEGWYACHQALIGWGGR